MPGSEKLCSAIGSRKKNREDAPRGAGCLLREWSGRMEQAREGHSQDTVLLSEEPLSTGCSVQLSSKR